jgi:hypothetical protein
MADDTDGALAAALMEALGNGAEGLDALAQRLNEAGPALASGGRWSADVLAAELAGRAGVPPKRAIASSVAPAYDTGRARLPHRLRSARNRSASSGSVSRSSCGVMKPVPCMPSRIAVRTAASRSRSVRCTRVP